MRSMRTICVGAGIVRTIIGSSIPERSNKSICQDASRWKHRLSFPSIKNSHITPAKIKEVDDRIVNDKHIQRFTITQYDFAIIPYDAVIAQIEFYDDACPTESLNIFATLSRNK